MNELGEVFGDNRELNQRALSWDASAVTTWLSASPKTLLGNQILGINLVVQ